LDTPWSTRQYWIILLWLHPVYIHTSDFDALVKVNTSLLERATKAIEILSPDTKRVGKVTASN
jgi:hypothetical protein